MLYYVHELQHLTLSPYRAWLSASRAVVAPWRHASAMRPLAAGLELADRLTRRYCKPEFGLQSVDIKPRDARRKSINVQICESIVDEHPFCNLLHFKKETPGLDQPKVLIVAPLSGHYATLLRGTVEAMLPEHDVYITDWTDTRDVPLDQGPFRLDDYIAVVIRHLELLGEDTNVIAVCQPSVPVMAAVALMSEDGKTVPRTMILMGGPVDTREAPTAVNTFAKEHSLEWFNSHSIHTVPPLYPGFGRKVYPGFLQLQGFLGMNMERHVNAHMDHFWHLVQGDGDGAAHHRKFYDEYLSVMDLPAEYFLDTVKAVFHDHALPQGTLEFKGRLVNPAAIKDVALITIEGELDDISGVGQTVAAHKICPNIPEHKRERVLQKNVGHYGIFNGRKWHGEIQPKIAAFIKANRGGNDI